MLFVCAITEQAMGWGSLRVARWAMVLAIAGRMVVNKWAICLIRAAQQGGFWVGTVDGVDGERTMSAYKILLVYFCVFFWYLHGRPIAGYGRVHSFFL